MVGGAQDYAAGSVRGGGNWSAYETRRFHEHALAEEKQKRADRVVRRLLALLVAAGGSLFLWVGARYGSGVAVTVGAMLLLFAGVYGTGRNVLSRAAQACLAAVVVAMLVLIACLAALAVFSIASTLLRGS